MVTGVCHNAQIAAISNDDLIIPIDFSSLNKKPRHANSSNNAETAEMDKPIIIFKISVFCEKISVLNLIILTALITNAINIGIIIENKNQILGLKEIPKEPFNFSLNISFCTIIADIIGKIIDIPIKFIEIEFDFPPIT